MTEPAEPPPFLRASLRLEGLATAAGTIACTATAAGFLGPLWWFFDLFSHFRVQYAFGLALLGLLLLALRRRRPALVFLLFFGVNAAVVLPLYSGKPAGSAPEGLKIRRLMLINVNTQRGDPERVRQAVLEADPDILVLQEISRRWVRTLDGLTNRYPHAVLLPRDDNFGIGLYSRLPIQKSRILFLGGAEVPTILATIRLDDRDLRLLATHPLPPAGAEYTRLRNEQLALLPDHVDASVPFLLAGDLNVTPWNRRFKQLVRQSGLLDSSQGRGIQPTWPAHNLLLRIPLDHVLHAPSILITDRFTGPDVKSDHFPLVVDFLIL